MFDQAPEDVIQKRLGICSECAFKKTLPLVKIDVCEVCGCPLRSKTKFLNQQCPKGKW